MSYVRMESQLFSCVQQSWNATQQMQFLLLRPPPSSVRDHSLKLGKIAIHFIYNSIQTFQSTIINKQVVTTNKW